MGFQAVAEQLGVFQAFALEHDFVENKVDLAAEKDAQWHIGSVLNPISASSGAGTAG